MGNSVPGARLVAQLGEGAVRGPHPVGREARWRQRRAFEPESDVVPPPAEALARQLLHEESLLSELDRDPHPHVQETMVQRADLAADPAVAEVRTADAEAGHALHRAPRGPASTRR